VWAATPEDVVGYTCSWKKAATNSWARANDVGQRRAGPYAMMMVIKVVCDRVEGLQPIGKMPGTGASFLTALW